MTRFVTMNRSIPMVTWGACQQIAVHYAAANVIRVIHVFPGSKPQFHVFEVE